MILDCIVRRGRGLFRSGGEVIRLREMSAATATWGAGRVRRSEWDGQAYRVRTSSRQRRSRTQETSGQSTFVINQLSLCIRMYIHVRYRRTDREREGPGIWKNAKRGVTSPRCYFLSNPSHAIRMTQPCAVRFRQCHFLVSTKQPHTHTHTHTHHHILLNRQLQKRIVSVVVLELFESN
jgi:hypothetical protein